MGFAQKTDQRPHQCAFQTLEQLLAWLTWQDQNGYTAYYACASFREFQVWDEKQQKFVRRTHGNFLAAADLWADVDTQESHANAKYVNRREAEQAILAFCQQAGLPPPLWVSSGGGLHVHWPLAAELELAEWQIHANGLRAACARYGLGIDARKTVDGSAVLRVPGSHNYKFDPPRIVQSGEAVARYSLAQFEKLKELGLAQPAQSKRFTRPDANTDSPLAKTIQGTIYDDPSDPQRAARYCAQLGSFVAGPGKFNDNFHFGVAGLCKVSCDGGDAIYLSWLDPEYRDAGQTKLDNWHSDKPATCEYFEGTSPQPELCKACPHYGKITTPAQLGRLAESQIERLAAARGQAIQLANSDVAAETASESDLNGFPSIEPPYALKGGKIVWEQESKDGEHIDAIVVVDHPIYVQGRYESECSKSACYAFRHQQPGRPWETISVPALEYKSGRGVALLSDKNVVIRDSNKFLDYAAKQLGKVVDSGRIGVRYEQCGLKTDGQVLFGNQLYGLGSTVNEAVVNAEIQARINLGLGLRPGADVRAFLAALNDLFPPDHYCAFLNIGLSGCSLFNPWHTRSAGGLIGVNWTPESAMGKSMIIWAAGAMWSSNREALWIKDIDTLSSQGLIMAALNNIPILIDEIQYWNRGPDGVTRLLELLSKLANGGDKNRAQPFGAGIAKQVLRFALNALCTSNADIIELIEVLGKQAASDHAQGNRVWVMDARPPHDFDGSRGDRLEQVLWDNGGSFMDAFLKRVLTSEASFKEAEKLVAARTEQLWKLGLGNEQRFRLRALGGAWAFAELCLSHGLWPTSSYDHIGSMVGWGVDQIKARIAATVTLTPNEQAVQVLDNYLRINASNTLRVEGPYKAHMHQIPIGNHRLNKLLIRWERSGAVYTPIREFRAFVVEQGLSYRDVVDSLRRQHIVVNDRRKITLGAGTDYSSAQVDCIELNGLHTALAPLASEIE